MPDAAAVAQQERLARRRARCRRRAPPDRRGSAPASAAAAAGPPSRPVPASRRAGCSTAAARHGSRRAGRRHRHARRGTTPARHCPAQSGGLSQSTGAKASRVSSSASAWKPWRMARPRWGLWKACCLFGQHPQERQAQAERLDRVPDADHLDRASRHGRTRGAKARATGLSGAVLVVAVGERSRCARSPRPAATSPTRSITPASERTA